MTRTDLTDDDKATAMRLKSAIWYTVSKIVQEETTILRSNPTSQFTANLTELVYNQALTLGEDLEMFANHAKRKTIQKDDLLMVCRRNDSLKEAMIEFSNKLSEEKRKEKEISKQKKSKTVSTSIGLGIDNKKKKSNGKEKLQTRLEIPTKSNSNSILNSKEKETEKDGNNDDNIVNRRTSGKNRPSKRTIPSDSEEEDLENYNEEDEINDSDEILVDSDLEMDLSAIENS